ncbi:hypothetical protein DERF_002150 [Dermatophagoides farinae]|uniref:Uncharacterized protein n=1 Tax=Dermatophagoides farinae TaxID=6954 RepID=A0A922IG27_DERFA|nr:hypothetical protein DERF_002150 [Dermatophagoides farinae]
MNLLSVDYDRLTFRHPYSLHGTRSVQLWLHNGQWRVFSICRYMMLCSIDANGVTPIPVATKTACSLSKMLDEGAP